MEEAGVILRVVGEFSTAVCRAEPLRHAENHGANDPLLLRCEQRPMSQMFRSEASFSSKEQNHVAFIATS